MIDINKLTLKAQEALMQAQRAATEHGNSQIESDHLLAALLSAQEGLALSVLKKLGVPEAELRRETEQRIGRLPKVTGGVGQAALSPPAQRRPGIGFERSRGPEG